jgi:serine/threonine-protein kinase
MPLPIDTLKGALSDRYRIERELGMGGMATVYLAEDLKHKRKVALKVLKPELAAVLGAERFVQEITTTAALQHPHILPLFDSGTADGFLFYVMPFIQGETLRDRLNRETQLGVDEAVRIAREVADALDYAHRHGVIHRDIKPENILLHDGRPMVADFGIALALSAAAGGRMTETGLSLGTPHYMSPEQATAEKEITARSDVYSLASVLYEMLAGQPPHLGGSAQQIIMKIIAEPVAPVTQFRKSVPPNVAAAVARALEKLPADRFDTAQAFSRALSEQTFTHGTGVGAAAASRAPAMRLFGRSVSWRAVAGALAVVSAVSIATGVMRSGVSTGAGVVTRAELTFISRSDSAIGISGVDVSPDGSMIVYAARPPGGKYNLYVRGIGDRAAHIVPGTDGARWPAFSPDNQSIAFVLESRGIRRIPVTGVVVESIVDETNTGTTIRALRWARDGFLYYDGDTKPGLTRVREHGGKPELILRAGDPESPDPLPDGKHVLYTECCSSTGDVRVLTIATGETKSLGVQAEEVRYVATGHLLLRTDAALKAVAFDARKLTVVGEPLSVLDSVAANGSVEYFALSGAGTAVYVVRPQSAGGGGSRLVFVDFSGRDSLLSLPEARYSDVRLSPDGRRIAFISSPPPPAAPRYGLDVHDLLLGTTTKRAFADSADPVGLAWNPNGQSIAVGLISLRDSIGLVVSVRADGTASPDTLLAPSGRGMGATLRAPTSFSSDAKRLLLTEIPNALGSGSPDLGVAVLSQKWSMAPPYLNADWSEQSGFISPDGAWVVYESAEERAPGAAGNLRKIYARSFPTPGQRFAVSDSVGRAPRWARDGRTVFYWRGTTLVAAAVRTTPTFAVIGRRNLFTRPTASGISYYDVHPDGKRFVMPVSAAAAGTPQAARPPEPPRLVLVVNWLEEFKRKLNAK